MTEKIAEQIESLKRGTVDIISEPELAEKLAQSAKTGRPHEAKGYIVVFDNRRMAVRMSRR